MVEDTKLFRVVAAPVKAGDRRWIHWVITYLIWAIYLAGEDDAFARDSVQKMQEYVVGLELKEELRVIRTVVAREIGQTYVAPFRRANNLGVPLSSLDLGLRNAVSRAIGSERKQEKSNCGCLTCRTD